MNATEKLAREFSRQLLKRIGIKQLVEANRRNAARGNDSCASHDFCDANVIMERAFRTAIGRAPLPKDGPMTDATVTLWNAAWTLAKTNSFYVEGKP